MSSRCSFFYKDGLHAYWDCFSHELSLEISATFFTDDGVHLTAKDKNYGYPCFSKQTWKEFAEAILKALEEHKDEIRDPKYGEEE